MVAVHDNSRILKLRMLLVLLDYTDQILIMVVRMVSSVLIDIASHDAVSVRISGRVRFPAAVNKGMRVLGSDDRVDHD